MARNAGRSQHACPLRTARPQAVWCPSGARSPEELVREGSTCVLRHAIAKMGLTHPIAYINASYYASRNSMAISLKECDEIHFRRSIHGSDRR